MTTRAAPASTTSLKPRVRATLRPYSSTPTMLFCVWSYHVVCELEDVGGGLQTRCLDVQRGKVWGGRVPYRARGSPEDCAAGEKGWGRPHRIDPSSTIHQPASGRGPANTDANFGPLPPYASMDVNLILYFSSVMA